jgi:hypothetical protein
MKKALIVTAVATLILGASCTKNPDDIDQRQSRIPTAPTVTVVSGSPVTVLPSTKKALGTVKIKAGKNLPGLEYGLDLIVRGATATSVKNSYFVAKNGQDSIVSTTMASGKSIANGIRYEFPWKSFSENRDYDVTFYGDVAIGTYTPSVVVWYRSGADPDIQELDEVGLPTITVKATLLTIKWIEETDVIKDGVPLKMYTAEITNGGSEAEGFSQFAYSVTVNDVGNNDQLRMNDLRWYVNNVDMTTQVMFSDGTGAPISFISEGTTKVYVTYTEGARHLKILPEETVKIQTVMTPAGFDHNGNGLSNQMLTDATQITPGYLNLLSPGSSVVKITALQPSGSTGTVYNITHSVIGPSYSFIPGSSSGKNTNGFGIPALEMQNFHQ